jgi:hypothetical protein
MTLVFTKLGIPPEEAAAVVLTFRAAMFWLPLVIGSSWRYAGFGPSGRRTREKPGLKRPLILSLIRTRDRRLAAEGQRTPATRESRNTEASDRSCQQTYHIEFIYGPPGNSHPQRSACPKQSRRDRPRSFTPLRSVQNDLFPGSNHADLVPGRGPWHSEEQSDKESSCSLTRPAG